MGKKTKTLPALVPAVIRNKLVKHDVLPRTAVQLSVEAFEKAIGGRQALIEALSSGEPDEAVRDVLEIIADPRFDDWSLSRICVRAGITPGAVFVAFKHAAMVRAHILAMLDTANKIPGIVTDLLSQAVAHQAPCTSCNGVGQKTAEPTEKKPNPMPFPCGVCQGLGTVHIPADLERQKIALELAQLLKKGGGIAVNTQVNVQPAGATHRGGSLEQLQQAVGQILYGEAGPPIAATEAEVVEEDPAG